MKIKSILLVAISLLMTVFISSCSSDSKEDETRTVTGITVDKDAFSLELESSGVIVATLEPKGATGEITWSSSEPSVAAVNEGVVTALKIGETTIVASYKGIHTASCVVTVTGKQLDPDDLPASLTGSDYAIIQIDETSYEAIKDKVIYDFRPDEENKHLYVWEDTFRAGTASGLNFYGQTEGWVSLVVGSVGWSGAGYHVGPGFGQIDLTRLNDNPEDYVFHIGLKSAQPNSSYLLIFTDGQSEAKVCIGTSDFVDGITYKPYANFSRDNEWHSVEIPVSHLNELGLFFDKPFTDVNIFAFLGGVVSGTTLDMDAVFFYKKAK